MPDQVCTDEWTTREEAEKFARSIDPHAEVCCFYYRDERLYLVAWIEGEDGWDLLLHDGWPYIRLFGEMELPTNGYDEAFAKANRIANACGYIASRIRLDGDYPNRRGIACYPSIGNPIAVWYEGDRLVSVSRY